LNNYLQDPFESVITFLYLFNAVLSFKIQVIELKVKISTQKTHKNIKNKQNPLYEYKDFEQFEYKP
jgi:hypothetical protein